MAIEENRLSFTTKNSHYIFKILSREVAALMEEAELLAVATHRMAQFSETDTIPADEVYRSLGISAEDIAACDEVEFE